jgi:hypothetical protein
MLEPEIWLALAVLTGCGNPPTEATTEPSTTDAAPTTGSPTATIGVGTADTGHATTGTTDTEACPPMPPAEGGYDPCAGLCDGGGQCLHDGRDFAVCTRGCFMDCNCWPAPAPGDAPVRCSDALLASASLCVLDCAAGQACPPGMHCVTALGICAHPFPGYDDTTGGTTDMGTASSGSTTDMGAASSGGTTDAGTESSGGTTDTGTESSGGTTDTGTESSGGSSSGGGATGIAT